jgi:hypothetical protein
MGSLVEFNSGHRRSEEKEFRLDVFKVATLLLSLDIDWDCNFLLYISGFRKKMGLWYIKRSMKELYLSMRSLQSYLYPYRMKVVP